MLIKTIIYLCLVLCLVSCVEINEEKDDMNLPGMPGNKKVGWSASGNLITGERTRQVTLQADFPRSESYILQFNKMNNPASNLPIRAEALIKWSVEGNSVSRRISIANGVALVGASQAVRVVMTDVTASLLNIPPVIPNNVEYNVSVQVTPGTRGTPAYPPVLVPLEGLNRLIGAVPLPVSVTVPIPEDAGVNSVLVVAHNVAGTIPPGALIIEQDAVLPPLVLATYDYDCVCGKFIPIVPGTGQIFIFMNFALFPADPSIFLTVYFGIEG